MTTISTLNNAALLILQQSNSFSSGSKETSAAEQTTSVVRTVDGRSEATYRGFRSTPDDLNNGDREKRYCIIGHLIAGTHAHGRAALCHLVQRLLMGLRQCLPPTRTKEEIVRVDEQEPNQCIGLACIADRKKRLGKCLGWTIGRTDPSEDKDSLCVPGANPVAGGIPVFCKS